MFSSEKSHTTNVNRQQQTAGTTFFRKAGEDTFFGSTEQNTFFSPTVQAKLTVSSPDDPQEKEADAVAEQVMRMPDPVSVPAGGSEEDGVQKKEDAITVQAKLGTAIHRSYLGDDTGSPDACDCGSAGSDIYRKHLSLYPSDVVQRSGRGPPVRSIQFEQSLSASKGGGSALPADTRQFMESRFHADFSGVRIHTGNQAEGLSTQIHAQAFTHGNDIYFNSGRYSPNTASGGLLLAHELTHTIQQGASKAVARKPLVQRSADAPVSQEEPVGSEAAQTLQPNNELSSCQNTEEQVQRSVIDDALSYIDSVTDCISLDLDVAKGCALQKAQQVALHIPGYRALRVVLGRDPITSDPIERNGHNFLEAAFDLMPGGLLLHQKLQEQQQLDAAAAWIDEQIARVENLVNGLFSAIETFWNGLDITDLGSPFEVLRNAAGIVLGFINQVIDFAVEAASELLEMIKEYLLTKIVDFVKTQTTAYPLLRVILGRDPITDEEVPTNGTNILNALLELGGEEGIQQRTQMQETGTFQKAVDFIDEGISLFSHTYDEMVTAFHNIWNIVTIDSLMDPIGTFTLIYNQFAGPVGRVLDFVLRVGAEILKFIKEVLMQRLSAWAREQRGYELVTVIIGKDPFTNAVVPRNVENIIRGFMSLMEGGREQFEQLKESGAIDRTVARVNAAVARLNMTPAYIVQLFMDLWNSFSIHDLANPVAAFQRILARFGEPIGRLINFVIQIVKIVIEGILIIMNFPFDLINNIIAKAMQAFEMIKRDPVGFLKNLLRAIKQGFIQFFDNILQHLLTGLAGWLTSELRDAGVPAFTDTSLRGIISWVLQVLGISMEKIWEKLAAHPRIGPQRVARIRSMINTLEGIWTFIKDVQERGMAAIWDKIQEQLANLWNTIIDAVKNWIMEQIVNRMVTRLLSMLDPTGIMAVVNSAIALYSAIQSFIKYLREMLEIVNSFVEGVVDIASGNITTAANYLERTLSRAVPVIIGFLANQVGLSGIGRRVGEMIGRAQEMVDQALTWLVNRAVDTGFNLIDRLLGRTTDEPDNRTPQEKQADVDRATEAAQRLLEDQSLGYEGVNSRLPDIRRQYRLNRIELVPALEGKYHVDVEINPRKSTTDQTLAGGAAVPDPVVPDLSSTAKSLADRFANGSNNKKYMRNKAGGFIGIVLKTPVNGTSVFSTQAALYSSSTGADMMMNPVRTILMQAQLRVPSSVRYGGADNAYHTENIVAAISRAIFAENRDKISKIISGVYTFLTPCNDCAFLPSGIGSSFGAGGSFQIATGNGLRSVLFEQGADPVDGTAGVLIAPGHINYQPASQLYNSVSDPSWFTSFTV